MKYSINPEFARRYDEWDKKKTGGYFFLGTTSKPLQSIGINPAKIYWDKEKIKKIKRDHPTMTDNIIKQIPNLLENPVMVTQSLTVTNRVVIFGELYDQSGHPVMAALELKPKGDIQNFVKVASAYPKNSLQNLINTSDILYIDPNRKRADTWFQTLRLQLPVGVTKYGSIGMVTYVEKDVNGKISFGDKKSEKTAMQIAFEKAQQNATSKSISEKVKDDTKFSLKDTANESDSQTKSKAFKEWFGDWENNPESASKIVNEDGTPRIIYHQTAAEFNVFSNANPLAGRNDSETPNGFFAKDNDADIGVGGNVAVYYIDAKKATGLLQKAGLQLPRFLFRTDGYIHNIRDSESSVKPKFENVTKRL